MKERILTATLLFLIAFTAIASSSSRIPANRRLGYRSARSAYRVLPRASVQRRLPVHPARVYYRTYRVPDFSWIDPDTGKETVFYRYVQKKFSVPCACPLCFDVGKRRTR